MGYNLFSYVDFGVHTCRKQSMHAYNNNNNKKNGVKYYFRFDINKIDSTTEQPCTIFQLCHFSSAFFSVEALNKWLENKSMANNSRTFAAMTWIFYASSICVSIHAIYNNFSAFSQRHGLKMLYFFCIPIGNGLMQLSRI